ncbi:MAG: zinc ribbon domain-containing protein [Oscillospiraceae bacterium]|nr:zinc ribbon domain-containing protein [Oscillospiraceae bacterium]
MALIKCSECGREISDKTAACIHCGCPVSESKTTTFGGFKVINSGSNGKDANQIIDELFSNNSSVQFTKVNPLKVEFHAVLSGAENERSRQSVYVKELGRNVEFTVPNTIKVGQSVRVQIQTEQYSCILFTVTSIAKSGVRQTAPAPAKSNQEAIAVIDQYKPNGFMRFLVSRRFYQLMLIYFVAIGYFLVEDGLYMASVGAAGMAPFFIPILIAKFLYPISHLKKYIKKNNLEDAIRNDSGYMNVAISVYNKLQSKKTLAYIRDLNHAAAQEIERLLAERKKKQSAK